MTSRNKIEDLNLLVDELMKDKPNESLVKDLMRNLHLPYSTDPIERINKVLLKLHPPIEENASQKDQQPKGKPQKDKEVSP
ncbi:MAG: hypothetical protein AB7F59_15595 [Bdellovibrionales bacterium]